MISKEVTLKTLRLFPKNAIRVIVLEFIFYFKGKLTYLPQAIFFPSGYKVCTDWFGKCKLLCLFAFFKGIVNVGIEGMYREVGVSTI